MAKTIQSCVSTPTPSGGVVSECLPAKETRIRVIASNIAGESMEIDVGISATVRDLKLQVAKNWRIPTVCQKWIMGTELLSEIDCLAQLCPSSSHGSHAEVAIPMTIVVTLEEALKNLGSKEASQRLAAVEALSQVELQEPCRVVYALTENIFRDKTSEVRLASLNALTRIPAAHGNGRAVSACAICLQWKDTALGGQWRESSIDVRQAAARALPSFVNISDDFQVRVAMKALCIASLLDSDLVRGIALDGFVTLDLPGDVNDFFSISNDLKDPDERKRAAATIGLEEVAKKGNHKVMAMCCENLRDDMLLVRRHAALALSRSWNSA